MKRLYSLFFITLTCFCLKAQNPIETIVLEGIEYHDAGDFDKAIEIYETALMLEPNSPLVNYEIALSYFQKKEYATAIAYADKVLKQKKDHLQSAYFVKGASLDLMGKMKASNKVFEKGIKETGEHYLFFYNMGFNYFKAGDLANSEKNLLKALELNFQHTTSHLVLAKIHSQRNNPIQVLLASHYFLFLEPDTFRSKEAYALLKSAMSGNVKRDANKPNTININFNPKEDDPFSSMALMLSLLEASKTSEKNLLKSEKEFFIETTGKIFKLLGDPTNQNKEEIWWSHYIPFFHKIALSEHLETYCMYILSNFDEEAANWIEDNENKLDSFDEWLKQ